MEKSKTFITQILEMGRQDKIYARCALSVYRAYKQFKVSLEKLVTMFGSLSGYPCENINDKALLSALSRLHNKYSKLRNKQRQDLETSVFEVPLKNRKR